MGSWAFVTQAAKLLAPLFIVYRLPVVLPPLGGFGEQELDVVLLLTNLFASGEDISFVGSIPGSGRSPGEGNGYPSILAWRTPWTEEPDGLQSIGLQRLGHH